MELLCRSGGEPMRVVAIDVETANADMASICAVGAATFEHGRLVSEWYSLVDSDDYFDPMNVAIHGIDENAVRGALGSFCICSSLR